MTVGHKFCWCIHTKCIPKCHHHSYRNQTRNATAKRRLNIHFCYVLINVYIGKKYIKKEGCYSTIPNNPIGDIWDTYSGTEKKTITLFIACCHCKESQTYLFLVFCHCKPKPSLPNIHLDLYKYQQIQVSDTYKIYSTERFYNRSHAM